MLYVGIDVSKDDFSVCFLRPESKNKKEKLPVFKYEQTRKGFKSFLSKLKSFGDKEPLAVMESTGTYHENLRKFMDDEGINVVVLNPASVKKHMDVLSKSKTDEIDARNLAKIAYHFMETVETSNIPQDKQLALRELVRFRQNLVEECSSYKKRLRNYLRLTMPEVLKEFSSMGSVVLLHLLKEYPTKEKMLADPEGVVELLRSHRWKEEDARDLLNNLKESIGGKKDQYGSYEKVILLCVKKISENEEEAEALKKEIEKLLKDYPDHPAGSIPGVGTISLAVIIGEAGDIFRFVTKKHFVSYTGLEPKLRESGRWRGNTRISKQGNAHLRHVFYQIASRVIGRSDKYKAIYNNLRDRGKTHKKAVTAIARKMAELAYVLTINDTTFSEEHS